MGAPVFCLDLRGTGESDGRFSFGDAEFLDVIAAIKFARQNYSDVKLLGFSLGAYSALRAHCEFPESIRELFLVSCPTSVLHIILQGHALKHSLSLLFEKPQFHKERNFAFRWGNPFPRKPSAEVFAIKAKAATHFLVGSKDYLVPPKMSSKVFGLLGSQEKTWKLIDDGHHAELLYIADPVAFKSWLQNP